MSNIIRWNPYREMIEMVNAMDRLVDGRFYNSPRAYRYAPKNWGLALDVAENEDEFLVKASLPGVNPDNIEITFEKNVLTIKGSVDEESESEERRYHLRERRYGEFCRSISLPTSVNAEAIDASYEAGVLTLSLPKLEEAKPKRIEVKAPKMIASKSKK